MKSIKRQENETNIIIEDIKRVQKEINMLEGKQARTYGEAETTMFQVCGPRYDLLDTPIRKPVLSCLSDV